MAIELNTRTRILAGVVVLAAAGAGAWFFYLQDLLDEPPPAKVAAKPAAKAPAQPAPKAAPGPGAEAAKPPVHAKPAAKPIPTDPAQLIAEVIETSGLKSSFQIFGDELARQAAAGDQSSALTEDEKLAVAEANRRVFEPGKMTAEISANLKTSLDAERMARFLEMLRQPIALKMTSEETRRAQPEALREFTENLRKTPSPAARVKLIQALDDVTRTSEIQSDMASAMVREMLDVMLAELQKAGKNAPKEARQTIAAQLNAIRTQARSQAIGSLHFMYRNASDEDLSAYIKLLDTDTGRWGMALLNDAVRPVLAGRFGAFGKDIAKLALAKHMGAMAKAPPAAPEPLPKAQPEIPADKPVASAAAPPPEPVGYRRPANTRDLYARYNDLITATVMRDRAAVKELLDDGKRPNARQADGTTPLMIAVGNGDAEIAAMLLAKGADPNLRTTGGFTALSIAKKRGSAGAELAQLLQRSGARE